jgi:hypothetical protein
MRKETCYATLIEIEELSIVVIRVILALRKMGSSKLAQDT